MLTQNGTGIQERDTLLKRGPNIPLSNFSPHEMPVGNI